MSQPPVTVVDFEFSRLEDNLPVINLHGPNALSVYFNKIVNVLAPEIDSSERDGFKRYENRTYPIPDSIRKNNNMAIVVMTKTWSKSGMFAHITLEMVKMLRKKCKDYPEHVWEFMKKFCIHKYLPNEHSCIIGLCELESVPFGVDLTPSQISEGALANFYVWKIKHAILFHTWIGYHSVEGKWHRFNPNRVRMEITKLEPSELSLNQVSTTNIGLATQIL